MILARLNLGRTNFWCNKHASLQHQLQHHSLQLQLRIKQNGSVQVQSEAVDGSDTDGLQQLK